MSKVRLSKRSRLKVNKKLVNKLYDRIYDRTIQQIDLFREQDRELPDESIHALVDDHVKSVLKDYGFQIMS